MSLIKLAIKSSTEIDADYKDKRSLGRRAKGKIIGYASIPFTGPVGPIVGHIMDRKRKEVDFRRNPEKFKKLYTERFRESEK